MTEHEIHMICCDQIDAEIEAHIAKRQFTAIVWKRDRKTKRYSYEVPMPYNYSR